MELSHELTRISRHNKKLNAKIAQRLLQTSKLDGFSGDLSVGVREGKEMADPASLVLPSWVSVVKDLPDSATADPGSASVSLLNFENSDMGEEDRDEDEESGNVEGMMTFASSLGEGSVGVDD